MPDCEDKFLNPFRIINAGHGQKIAEFMLKRTEEGLGWRHVTWRFNLATLDKILRTPHLDYSAADRAKIQIAADQLRAEGMR
jgi:hypothetical protein